MLIAASPARGQWQLMVVQSLTLVLLLYSTIRMYLVLRQNKREMRRQQEERRLFMERQIQEQAFGERQIQEQAFGFTDVFLATAPLAAQPNEYTERLIALFPNQAESIRGGTVNIITRSKRSWRIYFGSHWGVQCNGKSFCVHATKVSSHPQKAYAFALWLLADEEMVIRQAQPRGGYGY